ncbi:jun dimerization protein 2-like [Ptychodera flava]|uniref:jun dimerization protein 2-like n=1 Tax=Ptychodera flava TaxID=63121 RepID=UPI00396A3DF2
MKQELKTPGQVSLGFDELRCPNWQYTLRLHTTGADDMAIHAPPIPQLHLLQKPEEYSAEDEERLKVRRMRNRSAAAKCRMKKKARELHLAEEAQRLQELNEKLMEQLKQLQEEKEQLSFIIKSHTLSCGFNPFTVVSQIASMDQRFQDRRHQTEHPSQRQPPTQGS